MRAPTLCLALTGLILSACATQPAWPDYPEPLFVETAEYIRLGEGPCFGVCPVYELTLYPGGSYVLMAGRFTEGEARSDNKPGEDSFERAQDILLAAGFADLPDDITPDNPEACPMPATDLPTAQVTIGNEAGYYRIVTYYQGCFIEALDTMLAELRATMRIADLVQAQGPEELQQQEAE